MPTYDPAKLSAMAAALRAGGRRPDPNLIAVTRLREIGDQSAALSRALRASSGERPLDTVTASEAAEIARITGEHPEWFGNATDDTTTPQTAEEREVDRIAREYLR